MKDYIRENKQEIKELGYTLETHPQLGYKEQINKRTLVEYFKKYGFTIENECYETAFTVSIGEGKPHIGLIAELDALPTLGHRYANSDDSNAAHSCGHASQCTIQSAVMVALKQQEIRKGKVTLFFCPAEEYTDMEFRKQLIKEGKIRYIGGKQNMIYDGLFDDCDCLIHLHTMSEPEYHYCVNTKQGGFVYKKITFIGKAAHAAVAPHEGINALNAYVLFQNAVNMLRETFKEEDCVRIHGIINEGGQTVNSIPERVVYECYVRSFNIDTIMKLSDQVDNAARCCASAIGAGCEIETQPGYVPLEQSEPLNRFVYDHMRKDYEEEEIQLNASSMAASDLGDLSLFKPVIQLGYGGFKGVAHSKDLEVIDPERCYIETSTLIKNIVLDLLEDEERMQMIKDAFKPRMTREEYLKYLG